MDSPKATSFEDAGSLSEFTVSESVMQNAAGLQQQSQLASFVPD
jgi:hypothetical protein